MNTVIKPDIRYFDESIQRVIETHSQAQMRVEIHKAISAEREACAVLCYQLVDNSRETRFAAAIRERSNT